MFKATKPFKDTITGYNDEPSLRIGRKVPQNAVNLAYYFNPTATDSEKILASDPPRQTIDHRVESQWLTKLDQASGPNGEEPDIDIFPKTIYYSDEEGYYGRLKRQDESVKWYPENHGVQIEKTFDNEQIVINKGDEDKVIEYSDADGFKGNLYLDTAEYEVYSTRDATVTEETDFTINGFELDFHKIFDTYLNSEEINNGPWMNEPNPLADEDYCWPATIELTATKLKCSDSGSVTTNTHNKIANYVNNLDNDFEGSNETHIDSTEVITTSKPVGLLYFEKLEYQPAKYQEQPKNGVLSQERIVNGIKSDSFNWQVHDITLTDYRNHVYNLNDIKIGGMTVQGQYLADTTNEDYSQIVTFIGMLQSTGQPFDVHVNLLNDAINNGKDIAIWINALRFVVEDESIDMLVDGSAVPGNEENEINPNADPSKCYWVLDYKYLISDKGQEGTVLYNVIATYHTIMTEGGCSVKRTLTSRKEEAASYRANCHYSGLVNKRWIDYDGIAYYLGSVTKGNSVGNQNADDNNELLMFPDKDGYLRQVVEGLKVTTGDDGRNIYETEMRSYYRVEADTVYLTDVFKDGQACFYKYRLKQPIYDYRGPDEDGFYKGDAVQIKTSMLREIPEDYKYNMKLVVAQYEEKTVVDPNNFQPTIVTVPKCYYAELYTSFISSSTDTFKVIYNGFNDINDDNTIINNGVEEDIYNAPYMIQNINYRMVTVNKKARVNRIQLIDYEPIKDERLRVTFTWQVVAINRLTGKVFVSEERQSSILNKDYCLPCEYEQFEERGMIISPRIEGDSIPCSPRDLCLYDQSCYQKADNDYQPVINDQDKDFVYSIRINQITKAGSVNVKCNPDGSGYITAETTLDTGFLNTVTQSYTKKLDMDNPYYVEIYNDPHTGKKQSFIHKGYKVKCIDSRNIKVKAPREENLLDSWYPLIQFGHYSRVMDQYGTHTKVYYSMPEYDTQHYSDKYGQPYMDVENEQVTILNSHMIKTKCYPLYVLEPNMDEDTFIFNNKFYKVIKQSKSWTQAETDCKRMGGHLAMPKSEDELNFLSKIAKKYDFKGLWLGGTDKDLEGHWKWIDGSSIVYSNWDSNEPNNSGGNEHYMMIYTSGDHAGKWNDLADTNTGNISGFICEYTNTIALYKVIDDEKFKLDIEYISFSDGVVITKDTISENDKIIADYTYLEENYNYRGYWRDQTDFIRIDLNPNIYHTYNNPVYLPSEVSPSKNLFNKVIYFFMRPTGMYEISSDQDDLYYSDMIEDINTGEISQMLIDNDNCLYHKIDDAEPNDDSDILVGSVYIRQNTSLHSTVITDSRTRGGGILEAIPDSLRQELEPESDYYLDIGYYDGKPYQENGVIVVRLDNRLLKEYGGRFTMGDVEQKVKRWLGLGVYPIIEFVDSYKKEDLPQYTLEIEDNYTNVFDITPEILLECVAV